MAIGPGGDLYWSDPAHCAIFRQSVCDGTIEQVDCVGGQGAGPTELGQPRGLIYHPGLSRLLISDSGNARITLLDPASHQVTGFWGRGALSDPRGLAVDSAGSVYVADLGHGLVKKFTPQGFEVASFAQAQAGYSIKPTELAVVRDASGKEQVFILDASAIVLLSTDGTGRQNISLSNNAQPIGLAVNAGRALYVGVGPLGKIQKYAIDGGYLGDAHYTGPVAALGMRGDGTLIVLYRGPVSIVNFKGEVDTTLVADGFGPLRLGLTSARVPIGRLMGGPFLDPTVEIESWHRLRAEGPAKPAGSRITLYIRRVGPAPPPTVPWPSTTVDLPTAQVASPPTPLADTWYRVAGAPVAVSSGHPR